MNTSLRKRLTKLSGLFLGLAMGLGVATGAAGNKAGEVKATVGGNVTIGSTEYESVYETGFEKASTGNNYQGTVTITSDKGDGAAWTIYYGTVSTSSKISGSNSAHMRLYSGSIKPYMEMTSSIADVSAFSFKYAVSNKAVKFDVLYSSDKGANWTKQASISPTGTAATTLSYELGSAVTDFRLKILATAGNPNSSNYTFRIDDIVFGKKKSVAPTANTYTVKFAGGGASGSKENELVDITKDFVVPDASGFTYSGKEFDYWSGSNGQTYHKDEKITAGTIGKDGEITLTAVWKNLPTKPDASQFTEIAIAGKNAIVKTSFDQTEYDAYKGGTSSVKAFSYTVNGIPAGASKLIIYAASWKGDGTCAASISSSYSDNNSIDLVEDTGLTSNTPFTLTEVNVWNDSYKIVYDLKNITSSTNITIEFTKRAAIWYTGYEMGNVKTLKSIAVTTNPTKTSYNAGEKFQTNGMVVKATYGNSQGSDTTETITGYTCNPLTSTALTSSDNKVTISYTEGGVTKTTEVAIDVAYFDGIKITTAASKTSYHDGEKFDVSGLVVKAVTKHSSGIADDEVDVTSSVTYKIGTSAATPGTTEVKKGDNQTVTISYNGKSATYSIDCGYAYVTGIEFGVAPENMGPGDTYSPTATVSPLTAEQGKTFTVKSQTEGVLVVFNDETLTISEGTEAGSVTLLVTSTGKKENGESATDEVTILVSAAAIPQLTGFAITGTATKATQYLNDTFELDLSGLTITGTYDIENPNPETFGIEDFLWETDLYDYPYGIYLLNSDLDISLQGYIKLVEDFCETIEFVNEDITNKTYYTTDESFDHTGLSISGKMASGDDAVIDTSKVEYIFSATPAELGAGTGKSVSVYAKYGDAKTDSITISGIEVKEIVLESISVTSQPSKLTYTIGESFSSNGIVVKGTNNDGSDAGTVTSECTFEYDETAFLKAGTPTITVKHSSGKTATFTVTVNARTLNPGTTTWTLVTASQSDWSGTYILGNSSTNGTIKIAEAGSFSSGEFAIKDATLSNGNLSGTDVKESNAIVITKDPNGTGYAICANGKYISRKATSNGIDVSETPVYGNTITYGSSKVTIAGAGGRVLTYYSNNSNFKYYASSNNCAQLFKMTKSQGESRTLAGITATYNHIGDKYYTGDEVVSADFTVKAWYNNGDTVNNVSGFTITDPTLDEGDNTIELSYEGKKCTVLVSGIETRSATVDHVYVETETDYQVNYYLDGTTAAWNLEKINVVAYWTDGTTNTSSLSDLVASGDVAISKAAPEVGDTSFTVSGSYYGTAIDQTHNSVTVSVVAKAISSLSWTQRFDGCSFNVFEGDTINKSVFAKQNSTSYIKATYNDGSSIEKFSIDNCSVALYRREGNENVWVKDVKFDEKENYTFEAEDDGLYFLLTAGGKTTQYSSSAIFHVCKKLNAIYVPGDDITKTITTSSFSPDLPTSTAGTGESTAEGITFTYDGLYDYTSSSKHHIALPKINGAYFASSKLPGDLKSIQIKKGGQNINSAATLYISKDGNTWDTAQAFGNAEFTYSVTGEGYRYFKIATDGSNYTNIGSLIVKYGGTKNIANTNADAQLALLNFVKDANQELIDACGNGGITSTSWSKVQQLYNDYFVTQNEENKDVFITDATTRNLAKDMLYYGEGGVWMASDENWKQAGLDELQRFLKSYDTGVSRYGMTQFIKNSSNTNRAIKPTKNTFSLFGENSLLGETSSATWIITIIALAGIAATGGYFYIRKRKED